MEEQIIKQILEKISIKNDIKDESISFSDKRYRAFELDKKNFHGIGSAITDKKIAFIDGGNADILNLGDLSLQLVRVYYNIFHKNKKIESKRHDFYVLVQTIGKEDKIEYSVEISPNNLLGSLMFDSFDDTLSEGKHRVNISKIGEAVRRFLELHLAKVVVDRLDKGDIIVLDGSLEASMTNEVDFFDGLFQKALEKDIIISGLSKSCTLLTDKGNSVLSVLKAISPAGCWYYYPAAEINSEEHQADLFFARLNENSKYIFKVDIFKKNSYSPDEVFSLLKDNSKDPVFLGYPYGLIDADKFARVSNNEKEYLKTMLMVRLKREDLGDRSVDAHSVLDSIG